MTSPDSPQFLTAQDRVHVLDTTQKLNNQLSLGAFLWDTKWLNVLRTLPRPILTDFNGVLVNSKRPWVVNPQAAEAVNRLVNTGTLIVVTSASADWELRKNALEDFGLWYPGMVLITEESYS